MNFLQQCTGKHENSLLLMNILLALISLGDLDIQWQYYSCTDLTYICTASLRLEPIMQAYFE